MDILGFVVLLLVANGAPLVTAYLTGSHYNQPIDRGVILSDGHPMLGPSKTWRGICVSLLATSVAAPVLGFSLTLGFTVAMLAMLGDLCSSFLKRRLGLASSSFAVGLDQIPEALLPTVALGMGVLDFSGLEILIIVCAFVALELISSRPLRRLGIRKQT